MLYRHTRSSSSSRRFADAKVSVGNPLSSSSASGSGEGEELTCFQFHIHDFTNLGTTKDHYVASPEFRCNGRQWQLLVFPGGDDQAADGQVSIYLHLRTQACISVVYGMKVIDKFGKPKVTKNSAIHPSNAKTDIFSCHGWADFISRSDILDESQNILDSHGMLTVVVFMKEEPKTSFVPQNPVVKIMNDMFNDVNSADVCFEVFSTDDEGILSLYAHRFIIEKCAPMLAAICGSNNDSGEVETVTINDVKPDIFRHLLFYVYGGSVPEHELKNHAKDIIDAADKYSIINLKLAAEAAYVDFTNISLDNAMDNLLYADSMNLALLKETVMNFFIENHREAAANISFSDFPGHVVKDLLIAVGSYINGNGARVDDMSVSALRRKLHNMGLEVDGSREVMIESIKSASRSHE